jgi:hypothetical protein
MRPAPNVEVVAMSVFKVLKAIGVAACAVVSVTLLMASGAFAASSIYLCIGEKVGQGVKSGGTTAPGTCPKLTETQKVVYVPVALPKESAEQQKLLSLLPHIKYEASGVGGKPTIQFSGVNLQVVNGEGKTASVNGEGNLVVGYDEKPGTQTGSHDLVLGEEQAFTSYGSIMTGEHNLAAERFTVVFGGFNEAVEELSSVTGGTHNKTLRGLPPGLGYAASSVSGGSGNTAEGPDAAVSGGASNYAVGSSHFGGDTSVSGGTHNTALGSGSSVSGGENNTAGSYDSWVGGGAHNQSSRPTEGGSWTSVSGGYKNNVEGNYASIFGGKELTANNEYEAIP